MIIKKGNRYFKNCPFCNEEQSYSRKRYAEESLSLNKLCKKCSNKIPDNNGHIGYYKGVLRKSFVHKYKTNAELRGIMWDVSFDYLADLLIEQNFKCALSGKLISSLKVSNNASLDRIDSNLGYIEGNLQWVSSTINMMKQSYTQEQFIYWCNKVANTHPITNNNNETSN